MIFSKKLLLHIHDSHLHPPTLQNNLYFSKPELQAIEPDLEEFMSSLVASVFSE